MSRRDNSRGHGGASTIEEEEPHRGSQNHPVSMTFGAHDEEDKNVEEDFEIVLENPVKDRADGEKAANEGDESANEGRPAVSRPVRRSEKQYNVDQDMKILELFFAKSRDANSSGIIQKRKERYSKKLSRTFESMRDRYKRHLKYLTQEEIATIKQISAEDPTKYYIYFDKPAFPGGPRKFRDVLRGDPAKITHIKENILKQQDRKEKEKTPPPRKEKVNPSPRPRKEPAPKPAASTEPRAKTPKTPKEPKEPKEAREPKERKSRTPKKKAVEDFVLRFAPTPSHGGFEILDFVPAEYVVGNGGNVTSMKKFQVSPAVGFKTDRFHQILKESGNSTQVTYDGKDYLFEIVNRVDYKQSPAVKGVLDGLSQLLNVDEAEAQRIFEALSQDVDEVKQYIGGNTKLLWRPIDDEALQSYIEHPQQNQPFYEKLVEQKGLRSVEKRVQYLTHQPKKH